MEKNAAVFLSPEELRNEKEKEKQAPRFITFKTGEEYYGISIEKVEEIIVMQDITKVPGNEEYVKGLINLRGKILPVIDVRLRFHLEPIEYTERTCIIITRIHSVPLGLIVEKIAEVVSIPEEDQLPVVRPGKTEAHRRGSDRFVFAMGKVGGDVKLLLSPEKLLQDSGVEALAEPEQT